jgi:transposase InsO family protein
VSKARLVITAVVLEGRSQSEVARAYGVSQPWVSRLVARYRAEGDTAFEPRSRRPRTSPNATPPATVELVVRLRKELSDQGLDAGPDTICWHLGRRGAAVSRSTVARLLTARGLVDPQPKKRPKSSYTRFQADLPNECWQSDFTHYRLADGSDAEIICWLDDCSRLALHVSAHSRVTGATVVSTFRRAVAAHGVPASTLTDNGMVYTVRLAGGRGGRNAFEAELRKLGVVQKNSRPNHPTTCGKAERFQQTLKKWLQAQPAQPRSVEDLQALCDAFADTYNNRRPHRSQPRRATPASRYDALPKALPSDSRDPDTHDRVRHDRVDKAGSVTLRHHGRLHHIGVGRRHAGTHVLLLVHDLHARIVDAATGELLRQLTIDPHRDYQPTGRRQTSEKPQPR